jgi:resuscitation-promoting factor RpfA
MPHLASPQNLPPGTTVDPTIGADPSPNVSYLKDIWHAIQTQEISGKDALLALTQRSMTSSGPAGTPPLSPVPPPAPGAPLPPAPGAAPAPDAAVPAPAPAPVLPPS